jgi:VWA domain-containing protein
MTRHRLVVLVLLAIGSSIAAAEDAKKASTDLSRQVKKLVDGGKDDEALARIKELGEAKTPESRKALMDLGVMIPIPKLYKAVIDILAAMTDEESMKGFQEEAQAKGPPDRRVFLADVMAAMKTPASSEVLALLTEDKSLVVLRAAIAALGKQRTKEAVDPLLKVLNRLEAAKDHGQVYQEVRDALFDVTSLDYDDPKDWEKWWSVSKATFDPRKKPEGATQVRKPSRDKAADFGGMKIFGKNVVFVIDTSGTMGLTQKDDIPGLTGVTGTDKPTVVKQAEEQMTKENQLLAKWWSRIEMAKRALLKALRGLDSRTKFNIVRFDTKVSSLEKKGLISDKKKGTDWVTRMSFQPNGNTNTGQALEMAFALDPSTTEIYFLSDGLPSADGVKNDPPEQILEKVESLNRFRKVKVHTFGYDPLQLSNGQENTELLSANEVLKKIAKQTGGSFTLLKVTEEKPPKDYHLRAGR